MAWSCETLFEQWSFISSRLLKVLVSNSIRRLSVQTNQRDDSTALTGWVRTFSQGSITIGTTSAVKLAKTLKWSHPWKEELYRVWDLFTNPFYCLKKESQKTLPVGGLPTLTWPRCECLCVYCVLWRTGVLTSVGPQLTPDVPGIHCDLDQD